MELALSILSLLYTDIRFNYAETINTAVKALITAFIFLVKCSSTPFLKMKAFKKIKRCPSITNKLLYIPMHELAQKIRQQLLTSEEVIAAYIQRCRDVNPVINAIVENRFEAALQEARDVDRLIKSGVKTEEVLARDTPLLGIPVTVKESIAVKGMSHNAGQAIKSRIVASNDADVVKRVKNAGGIILLVSNTPELCMCWETYNNVTGTTWNPYDTRRTPGGSSGGEAALLASAASVISISSDIGGSARLPAMFCGVFGHKPTPGWISTDGHKPNSTDPSWPSFLSIAPMLRYSADLPIFLQAMSQTETAITQLNKKVNIGNIKFYYMEEFPCSVTNSVDREIIGGIHKFISHLENVHGIKVQKADVPEMKYAFEAATTVLLRLRGVDTIYSKESDPDNWKSVSAELFRYLCFISPHSFTNVAYGILKRVSEKFPESHYEWMHQKNESIKRRFQELLGDNGVLICPTFTSAAHYPYEIYPKICNVVYMMVYNALGLPVTQCPIGFNKDGLPIGFQIVGNVNNDHLTIAVAQEIERSLGGWHEPPCESTVV